MIFRAVRKNQKQNDLLRPARLTQESKVNTLSPHAGTTGFHAETMIKSSIKLKNTCQMDPKWREWAAR